MKFVVCIESALDVTQSFQIVENKQEIVNSSQILNPWDEFAIEAAILQKEKMDGEIIVLTIGLEECEKSLRNAFAMGCNTMIRVDIDANNLKQKQISKILSAAIQKIDAVDLVFLGKKSIDYETGTIPTMLAHQLNLPFIADVSIIEEINSRRLIAAFQIEQEKIRAEITLPAVISINKDFAEPRFPSFLGTRKAAKTPVQVFTLQDLSIQSINQPENEFILTEIPQRNIRTEMIQGDNAEEIVSKLENKLFGVAI
jgi:electron transfer flavoprotein beta subunit